MPPRDGRWSNLPSVITPVGAAPSDASATAWTVDQNLISEDAQSSQHNMPSELLFVDVVNKRNVNKRQNAALRRDSDSF